MAKQLMCTRKPEGEVSVRSEKTVTAWSQAVA